MNLLALIVLALGAAPSAATGFAPPPPHVQDVHQKAYDDFVARFRQFLKLNDASEMERMVRKDPAVAVRYADWLTQQVVVAGSEETEKEVNALRLAWKAAMKTDFVEKLYEYHSLIEPRNRAERMRMTQEYDLAFGRYLQVVNGDRSATGFQAASDEFETLAKAFQAVGDKLNVGRCYLVIGTCWDEGVRGKKEANLYRACAAQKAALAAYDEIGLVGPDVSQLRIRFESLVANGFDSPEPDPGAPKAGQPVAAAGAAVINVPMTFEAVPEVEAFLRPNYFADDIYQVWMALGLQAKGSSATIAAQQQGSPSIERTGSAQFRVQDGSETPREPYAVTGKLTLVEAFVDDAGRKRPWAFVTKVGMQDDTYQGRKANMGPSDEYMSLFYFNAASVVGTLDGVPVRVLDDNLDGVYGSPPLNWQYLGLAPGVSQPDMDCVVVGKSTRALPWSEFLQVGPRWYQLAPQSGGTILQAVPVELQTGSLRLEFKGEFPEWLVLRGTGALENTFIDLCANGKKAVEVPIGEYRLLSGLIRKGKKQQTMKCLVLGNEQVAPWEVTAGAEVVVKLGGPFSFDFDVIRDGDKVAVAGPSVRVIGSAGETYDRFWNCVPEPGVSTRKAGAKRGGKPEDMPQVKGSLDELTESGARRWNYADVWRPMTKELELKKPGETVEVQLVEKKNKLLGAIESPWK